MKNCRMLLAAALSAVAFGVVSCGEKALIGGCLKDAPGDSLIVKLLDVNSFTTLDTLATDADGRFRYKMKMEEGQPEFVYLFHSEDKVASLILLPGDKVTVEACTDGTYTVSGSEESSKLQAVEERFSEFARQMAAASAGFETASQEEQTQMRKDIAALYINYYRSCVGYVMSNAHSLSCIPLLYQNVNAGFPVFSQNTDAIHFRSVCDSLKQDYPDSRYVRALSKEADRREDLMNLRNRLDSVEAVGYPDLELPGIKGGKVALSSIDAKVVLVRFWSAADAAQKMANLDNLIPLYEKYHSKGFEIYDISVDTDKAVWASVVRSQNLPWVSVCDGFGAASSAVRTYNVTSVPAWFIIADGMLAPDRISSWKELEQAVAKRLK